MGRPKLDKSSVVIQYRTSVDKLEAIKEIQRKLGHKTISETHRMIEEYGIFYYTMKDADIDI